MATLAMAGTAIADKDYDDYAHHRGFDFKPLDESANSDDWNPAAPWKLPKGFTQYVVADESALNIYDYPTWNNAGTPQSNDWNDMNTVNETGPQAGRFMYRTHEVRGAATGGSVSVVDLQTGETRILVQDESWSAIDGIRWTPWGTLLVAEETTGGRLVEIFLNDDMMSVAEVIERPAAGRLAHEGIEADSEGNVYVVDEYRGRSEGCGGVIPCGGGIYKFVPDTYGDLSSGSLYVLGIEKNGRRDNTGQGVWLGPIDAAHARESGSDFGGASYQRPEDMEIIDGKLYAAITEGPRDEYGKEYYEGRVIAIDLESMEVSNFVKAGVNIPVEIGKPGEEGHQSGFDSVDNLAEAPNGDLVIIEDNSPSDIWFASTSLVDEFGASRSVALFASLTDPSAEGTGIYFSPTDPATLYVNVQHSAKDDGDTTWAITHKRHHSFDR